MYTRTSKLFTQKELDQFFCDVDDLAVAARRVCHKIKYDRKRKDYSEEQKSLLHRAEYDALIDIDNIIERVLRKLETRMALGKSVRQR